MIRIRVLSLDLDMKLVFPDKRGSLDLNSPPFGNDPPNLGKVLKPRFQVLYNYLFSRVLSNSSYPLFSRSYLYLLDSQVQRTTGVPWEYDMF